MSVNCASLYLDIPFSCKNWSNVSFTIKSSKNTSISIITCIYAIDNSFKKVYTYIRCGNEVKIMPDYELLFYQSQEELKNLINQLDELTLNLMKFVVYCKKTVEQSNKNENPENKKRA